MTQATAPSTPDPRRQRQGWPVLLLVALAGVGWLERSNAEWLPLPLKEILDFLFLLMGMLAGLAVWHRFLLAPAYLLLDALYLVVLAAAADWFLFHERAGMAPWYGFQFCLLVAALAVSVYWLFKPRRDAVATGGRILLLNQFYPPDVAPTGVVLHDLARTLVARGHRVDVICSRRSYDGGALFPAEEVADGVQIRRLPALGFGRKNALARLADYGSFYLLLAWRLAVLRHQPDVILALTTPPYIGLLARLAAGWHRCRHMHWIMDIYPDVMVAYGMLKPGAAYRLLQWLKRRELAQASLVVGLGPNMAQKLEPYCAVEHLRWVALWSDTEPDEAGAQALRRTRGWGNERLVCLYSGNMGLGHRFGEFLAAAEAGGAEGPLFVFSGGGKRKREIEVFAQAGNRPQVIVMNYVPREQLPAHLGSADVHLVSLDDEWQGLIVPSKLQGIFAMGRAALFVGSTENEIATWILESKAGWVVAANDPASMRRALAEAAEPAERKNRGARARAFALAQFDRTRNCIQMAEMIETAARLTASAVPNLPVGSVKTVS